MKKILSVICTVLLFLGCTKDVELQIDSDPNPSTQKGNCKISVRLDDDSQTRVNIDRTVISWKKRDLIVIAEAGENGTFDKLIYYYVDDASISEDGKCADFYGEKLDTNKKYIAMIGRVYRETDDYYQSKGIVNMLRINCGGIPQTESEDNYNIVNDWCMMSSPFMGDASGELSIGLKNMCSYMELDLSMAESNVSCNIERIIINAPSPMFKSTLYMNNNKDIVYSTNTSYKYSTLNGNPTISNSNNYIAYVPFIPNDKITNVEGDLKFTIITTDSKESSVTIPAKALTKGKLYTKTLKFPAPVDMVKSDREILIDLYNATNGDNWTDNENWCTDAPLSEWSGVMTNQDGRVWSVSLYSNNLDGYIPESIGGLTCLSDLRFVNNDKLTGVIPESIGDLSRLDCLYLHMGKDMKCSIPESIGNLRNLVSLDIYGENLSGKIPESIGYIPDLQFLEIYSTKLTGSIPESFKNLTSLKRLMISGVGCDNSGNGLCQIKGEIPDIFDNLTDLTNLSITFCNISGQLPTSMSKLQNLEYLSLSYNQLEGSIDVLGNLSNLESLDLVKNKFTGAIPESMGERPLWSKLVWDILDQRPGYGFTSIPDAYLEPSTVTTIENKTVNTQEFFSDNKLTCVLFWRSWCGYSTYYMETVKDLYKSYSSKGFGLISLNDESDLSTIKSYVANNDIPGHVCQLTDWDYSEGSNRIKYMPTIGSPTYAFVDSEGKIVFCESIFPFEDPTMSREEATREFVNDYFGGSDPSDLYESTDYSKDGEVITLQSASVGNGIDIVIVGDGFVDTDMASGGEYETRMGEAMEHFFSEEPYKTFRNRYNVYAVKAVSKNSGVDGVSKTVFSSEFGEGTAISGDNSMVFRYALEVPSINSTDRLTIITVLNSSKYAGTCYMYTNDASIAYCPIVYNNDEQFRQIITHESGGHGFAKLLDEYAYAGTIPSDRVDSFIEFEKAMGWGANVDVTDDPNTIQWAHFLSDDRYSNLVGIYEGALTYEYGAYRPTDVSIMRFNTGGYNAPSREEIYRRIMEFSGSTYNYEDFVAYDAINRSTSSQAYRESQARTINRSAFKPLGEPVVIMGSPDVK